jgi:hypothetical protein
MRIASTVLSIVTLILVQLASMSTTPLNQPVTVTMTDAQLAPSNQAGETRSQAASAAPVRRINVPYFAEDVPFAQMAIAWLGQVSATSNYADMRLAYTADELYVNVKVFDRRLWYQTEPTPATLTDWDAVSLYVSRAGNTGQAPSSEAYRFDAQLTWWETPRDSWQAAYQGNGSGWGAASVPFTTVAGWRGDAPNNDVDDRGWAMEFHIPFSSLGLAGAPAQGTIWGLALAVHDRDGAADTAIPDQTWPETANMTQTNTWGQLAFGLPAYTPASSTSGRIVTIRQGLNGAIVMDAPVGGGTDCGANLDYWTQWGPKNYAGVDRFNVQNQDDESDWPCFSKYYVTFPLSSLPAGKVVVTATLTLHQFGNAGEGWTPPPISSYIQVLTTDQDWTESTLTWNNAPLARENIAGTWVDPLDSLPPWPGVARHWDIGRAVAEAYAAGQPLRLVLYSADGAYHSGRYFSASEVGDWDAEGRPTLSIMWGEPSGGPAPTPTSGASPVPTKAPSPSATPTATGRYTPLPSPTATATAATRPRASRTPTGTRTPSNHQYLPVLIRF